MVDNNLLADDGARHLGRELRYSICLRKLDCSYNAVADRGLAHLLLGLFLGPPMVKAPSGAATVLLRPETAPTRPPTAAVRITSKGVVEVPDGATADAAGAKPEAVAATAGLGSMLPEEAAAEGTKPGEAGEAGKREEGAEVEASAQPREATKDFGVAAGEDGASSSEGAAAGGGGDGSVPPVADAAATASKPLVDEEDEDEEQGEGGVTFIGHDNGK